jgi:hypothetical protein
MYVVREGQERTGHQIASEMWWNALLCTASARSANSRRHHPISQSRIIETASSLFQPLHPQIPSNLTISQSA